MTPSETVKEKPAVSLTKSLTDTEKTPTTALPVFEATFTEALITRPVFHGQGVGERAGEDGRERIQGLVYSGESQTAGHLRVRIGS